jgi:signal peptidase II
MNRNWVLILIACTAFALDIWLKAFTHEHIPRMSAFFPSFPYGGIGVFHNWLGIDFSINHVTNFGAAWGVLGAHRELLLGLRIVMIGAMAVYLFFYNKIAARKLPLALILTGACANVLDYFLYGHVIDMFHFTFWGYSIADATICCGVLLLLIYPWLGRDKQGAERLKKPHP